MARSLFLAAMGIEAVVNRVEPEVAHRLLAVADELDLAIRDVRNTVFGEVPGPGGPPASNEPE